MIAGLEPLQTEDLAPLDQPNEKEVFVVPRPPYEHIKPPTDFDCEDHQEPLIEVSTDMIKALSHDYFSAAGTKGEDGIYRRGLLAHRFC